jgi:hypothetical protein
MFRSSAIIRELVLSLAKVVLKHSVKLCPYRFFGGVAACLGVACILRWTQCVIQKDGLFLTSIFPELYMVCE